MPGEIRLSQFRWINQPAQFSIMDDLLTLSTDPATDFWQRTYYGFQHDNGHAFVVTITDQEFSFTVKASWIPEQLYDQCGILLYQNADNWFKASVEYENEQFSRLGSVVSNLGYSDWATTDIPSAQKGMTYRLSRRGQDFRIENAEDGQQFKQMRIFHMHQLTDPIRMGVYACSPLNSSMEVVFSHFSLDECVWEPFDDPEA